MVQVAPDEGRSWKGQLLTTFKAPSPVLNCLPLAGGGALLHLRGGDVVHCDAAGRFTLPSISPPPPRFLSAIFPVPSQTLPCTFLVSPLSLPCTSSIPPQHLPSISLPPPQYRDFTCVSFYD